MKPKTKKVLFIVSLIPYVIIILIGIYFAIFGYHFDYINSTDYGLEAMGDFLLGDVLFGIDFLWQKAICFALLIGYQIYYLLSKNREKQEKDTNKKKIRLGKIIFVISIICWMIYFAYAIGCFFWGYNTGIINMHRVYGLEAIREALLWNLIAFSLVPVLPISLIYIVIYLVLNRKRT